MDPALAPGTSAKPPVFQDALGERHRTNDVSGADAIEQLYLRSELTAIPSFEFALRERASRLATFRHTYYARVRSVDRLNDRTSSLAVVSDAVKGVRLQNLLAATERRPLPLDLNASLHLIRQLVSAVALLHENARDVAHGAIGPERIIITPNARVVLAEYVLGAALEQLHYSHDRYWKELRIPTPPSPGLPRFDHRADVTQVGVVALELVLCRLLHEDEYPNKIAEVVASARAMTAKGTSEPLPQGLRSWISRALQLDPRHSFSTAIDARDELDRVLAAEDGDDAGDDEEFDDTPLSDAPAPAASAATEVRTTAPALPVETTAPFADKVADKTLATPASHAPFSASTTLTPPAASSAPPKPFSTPDFLRRDEPPAFQFKTAAAPTPKAEFHFGADAGQDDAETEREAVAHGRRPWGRLAAIAAALVIVSTAGVVGTRRYLMPPATASGTGTLSISTNPPGAQILVDGQTRGVTPLTLSLSAGSHAVEVRGGGDPRTIPVTIAAGTQVSQYIELPKMATAFGQLHIRTEPAGADVTVDGIPRGKSPTLIESLAAGEHVVVLERDAATVKQTVTIEAGATASLLVPLVAAETAPQSGWIAVSAPVEVQLYENGRLIGTSQSDRLMVTAGRHEIEIVNEPLGYRTVRTLQVPAGRVAPVRIEWPKGTIAVNALPWAEVWIDGERVGETPLGNLSLAIGPHELVFRHPDLGEQRYATTVTLKAPTRVSVDLRKK